MTRQPVPRFRRAVAALAGLSGLALIPAMPETAAADPPHWAAAWGIKASRPRPVPTGRDIAIVFTKGATPAKTAHMARGLPFGFNRGTCDRAAVADALLDGIAGGLAAGVAGAQLAATSDEAVAVSGAAVGVLVGTLVDETAGRAMDEIDRGCVVEALNYLPDGDRIAWTNPGYRARYALMPTGTARDPDGLRCRGYRAEVVIRGQRHRVPGTACRRSDGVWEVMDTPFAREAG